jgi:cyclopropane-fatty-acyl-phospholipid synthase
MAAARALEWAEQGRVPDALIRAGIRRLVRSRLDELADGDPACQADIAERFLASLAVSELAPLPELANAQHYEVPAPFFAGVLGPHRKYSSCFYATPATTLDEAEADALHISCERARLANGQQVLELGCGWGSLSLWMAAQYPDSHITAVSNSVSQRAFIEAAATERGLRNLRVITCDMNRFASDVRFDRIVSVEMFEHMRNWPELFGRVASWLRDEGLFFMHVFVHRAVPYAFVDAGEEDWMSRHFFSGGMMPSDDLALRCQQQLRLLHRWRWDGRHYQRTANHWLANMDANRARLWPVIEQTYGRDQAQRWWMRWRMFFMACAEMFGYEEGRQWWVSHYLFSRRPQLS